MKLTAKPKTETKTIYLLDPGDFQDVVVVDERPQALLTLKQAKEACAFARLYSYNMKYGWKQYFADHKIWDKAFSSDIKNKLHSAVRSDEARKMMDAP